MTNGTQLGAGPDIIAQPMLLTAVIYGLENAENPLMKYINIVMGHRL